MKINDIFSYKLIMDYLKEEFPNIPDDEAKAIALTFGFAHVNDYVQIPKFLYQKPDEEKENMTRFKLWLKLREEGMGGRKMTFEEKAEEFGKVFGDERTSIRKYLQNEIRRKQERRYNMLMITKDGRVQVKPEDRIKINSTYGISGYDNPNLKKVFEELKEMRGDKNVR